MKTIRHYNTEDIDLKDPVHGWLSSVIIIALISYKPPAEGEDPTTPLKEVIAVALNAAESQGITITKE